MADDTDYTSFDPASTLSANDPLQEWANNNIDWRTGKLLQQDPQSAINSLIARGVPPPSADAPLAYVGEAGMGGAPDPDANAPIRTNPNGTIAGNITSPSPPGGPSAPPGTNPQAPPKPANLPNTATTPKQTPAEDDSSEDEPKKTASDDDSKKKKKTKADDAGDALAGFSKSLAGVKAPEQPKISPIGTPGAPHPNAISTPDISKLVGLLQGGAVPASVAPGNVLASLLRR